MHYLLCCTLLAPGAAPPPAEARLLEVHKLWDKGPHNAFTDLVRFKGAWYCTFREGKAHVSPDGAVRVLTSADGKKWESSALLTSKTADLRDPKLTVTPDGRLMLCAAAALHKPAGFRHQSLVWFLGKGGWGDPVEVGDPGFWLWRVTWHGKAAYGVGYSTDKVRESRLARLYTSADGRTFKALVPTLSAKGSPGEATLRFLPDGTCLCLLRRDGTPNTALLGSARPPYKEWTWKDLGRRVGGPNMIRLPDGRIFACVRLYDGRARTALCALDPAAGKLRELLTLPSGGDTSYAGLVWHDDLLWVSYYSSHEKRSSIYLAKIRIPPKAGSRGEEGKASCAGRDG